MQPQYNNNQFQPQQQPNVFIHPTIVVTNQPMGASNIGNSTLPTFEHVQMNRWKDDWCACFNQCVPSCLMTWFCCCVMSGQISQRIGFMNCGLVVSGWVAILIFYYIIAQFAYVNLAYVVWAIAAIFIWQLRRVFRQKFQIQGNDLEDCCLSWFCGHCTISQMARHIYNYGNGSECVCSSDGRPGFEIYNQGAGAGRVQHNQQPVFAPAHQFGQQQQQQAPMYAQGLGQGQSPVYVQQQQQPVYAQAQPIPVYPQHVQPVYVQTSNMQQQQQPQQQQQQGSSHGYVQQQQGSAHGYGQQQQGPSHGYEQQQGSAHGYGQPPPVSYHGEAQPPLFVQVAYPNGPEQSKN